MDVRDVAEAVYRLHKENVFGERFILNAGTSTYQELFTLVAKGMGKKPPSIEIGTTLLKVASIFDKLKSILTGKPPLITRETVILSEMDFFFDNQKIIENTSIEFRPLQDTIEWVCKNQTS